MKAALWKSSRYGSAQDATFAALFASSLHSANAKQKETTAEGKEVKGQGGQQQGWEIMNYKRENRYVKGRGKGRDGVKGSTGTADS